MAYRKALGLASDSAGPSSRNASEAAVIHTIGSEDSESEEEGNSTGSASSTAHHWRGLLDDRLADLITKPDCSPEELLLASGKLSIFSNLMIELHRTHHRVLVFSQSRQMLNIISKVLSIQGLR